MIWEIRRTKVKFDLNKHCSNVVVGNLKSQVNKLSSCSANSVFWYFPDVAHCNGTKMMLLMFTLINILNEEISELLSGWWTCIYKEKMKYPQNWFNNGLCFLGCFNYSERYVYMIIVIDGDLDCKKNFNLSNNDTNLALKILQSFIQKTSATKKSLSKPPKCLFLLSWSNEKNYKKVEF